MTAFSMFLVVIMCFQEWRGVAAGDLSVVFPVVMMCFQECRGAAAGEGFGLFSFCPYIQQVAVILR